jgi:hypothetical protein
MLTQADYERARSPIRSHVRYLTDAITGRGTGFTAANAASAPDWEGRWLTSDQDRLRQIDLLEKTTGDPRFRKQIDDQADTFRTSAVKQSEAGHRDVMGAARADLARGGVVGSSMDAERTAAIDLRLAKAKAQAQAQAEEIRAAGLTGLGNQEQQLLEQILAEDEDYGPAMEAQNTAIQGAGMSSQANQDYDTLLASAVAGFLNNTGTPALTEGFTAADRENQRRYDAWRDGGYQNGRPDTASWWNL